MMSTDQDEVARKAREHEEAHLALVPKPVAEMTFREVVAAQNEHPREYRGPTYDRYVALQAAKEAAQDEIAAARALARQGRPPEERWFLETVADESIRALERAVQAEPSDAGARERLAEARRRRRIVSVDGAADPRLAAWRGVAWKRVVRDVRPLTSWDEEDPPTVEGMKALEEGLARALASVKLLREQLEVERGL